MSTPPGVMEGAPQIYRRVVIHNGTKNAAEIKFPTDVNAIACDPAPGLTRLQMFANVGFAGGQQEGGNVPAQRALFEVWNPLVQPVLELGAPVSSIYVFCDETPIDADGNFEQSDFYGMIGSTRGAMIGRAHQRADLDAIQGVQTPRAIATLPTQPVHTFGPENGLLDTSAAGWNAVHVPCGAGVNTQLFTPGANRDILGVMVRIELSGGFGWIKLDDIAINRGILLRGTDPPMFIPSGSHNVEFWNGGALADVSVAVVRGYQAIP